MFVKTLSIIGIDLICLMLYSYYTVNFYSPLGIAVMLYVFECTARIAYSVKTHYKKNTQTVYARGLLKPPVFLRILICRGCEQTGKIQIFSLLLLTTPVLGYII